MRFYGVRLTGIDCKASLGVFAWNEETRTSDQERPGHVREGKEKQGSSAVSVNCEECLP
jgi:hypothetical protein